MNLAQTLIADPTFNLMTRAEKLEEARAIGLVAGMEDDDLAFALAVEEAEELATRGPVERDRDGRRDAILSAAAGIEPCREDRASCASPVAGNGRCMECGARRDVERPATRAEDRETVRPVVAALKSQEADKALLTIKLAAPVLARFKAVTGHNDRDIGDLLNMARSTVQATVGGRMPEKLTPAQLWVLSQTLSRQVQAIDDLRSELKERLA